MPRNYSEALPTPESIASYVSKNMLKAAMRPMHPMESVREADHNGHHIVVRTAYRIEVDGRPVTGHIDVSNEGTIAYHGLPNMSFDSTVDLVKMLIDQFPDDFSKGIARPRARKTPGTSPMVMGGMDMQRVSPKPAGSTSKKMTPPAGRKL
jgi:hypothetical protein